MRRRRSFTQPKARRKTGGLEKEERQSTNAGTPVPRAKLRQRGIATTKAGLPGGKERRQSCYRKKRSGRWTTEKKEERKVEDKKDSGTDKSAKGKGRRRDGETW